MAMSKRQGQRQQELWIPATQMPDAPGHPPDELLADGQAEAGAPEAAHRRGVRLSEAVEDGRLLVGRDADPGVADLEAQPDPGRVPGLGSALDGDLSMLGEFHGVRYQVEEELTQPNRISERRHGDV